MKRSPLVRRTPLKASAPLGPGKALARGTARLKARRRPAAGTVEQRELFKALVCFGESARCAMHGRDDGRCDGPLEAHHVVSQEWIRHAFVGNPEKVARALWDARNGMPLCRRHHARHTNAVKRVPLAALSVRNAEFAHEMGPAAELFVERHYRLARAEA